VRERETAQFLTRSLTLSTAHLITLTSARVGVRGSIRARMRVRGKAMVRVRQPHSMLCGQQALMIVETELAE
jgi:hypothetical protein